MTPSEAEIEYVATQASRDSLYFFTRWMFKTRRGYRWTVGRHHAIIARALERVFYGRCRRLIINIPPRAGKTEIAVVNFIAWALGHCPDSEFIYTSYSARLAANFSWQTREMAMMPEYARIFPKCLIRTDSKAKDEWRTTSGGIVYAVGSGGTITGYGAGKQRPGFGGAIIIDDPHKASEAKSDIIREGVLEWFQTTLESRRNDPNTPIILIMQRLHERDLAGWLLDGGNGETWEHVCLPALNPDGTSLWPEKWTVEELLRMQAANPYVFSGQYMQSPSPDEGGEFKPGNIEIIEALPAGIEWVRAWDLGSTTDGDWTAGAKLGRTQDGRLVIGDMERKRLGPDERDTLILNTARRDGYSTVTSIPQDPGQAGKTQVRYLTKMLAGYRVKSSPESGDKVTRASPFAAQVNVGNVMMLRADWNDALIDEMRMFPNGSFDDQIDALSRAFAELIGSNEAEIYMPERDLGHEAKRRALNGNLPGLPQTLVSALEGLPAGVVCGRCTSFSEGRCGQTGYAVQPADLGCGYFTEEFEQIDE